MNNWKQLTVMTVFTLIIGLGFTGCPFTNNGDDSSGSGLRPTGPEAMSGKTALQFFADNEIKAGWNLGNTLDAVRNWVEPGQLPPLSIALETDWMNPKATQQLFNGLKESGFDIVRIPVTWIGHIGPAPDYTIDEKRLRRVAEVIDYAKNAGIKAMIINIHHDGYTYPGLGKTWGFLDFPSAVDNPAKKNEIQDEIAKVWTQIAEYFKNYGDYLIFETFNEIHSGNWGHDAPANEQDILFDWNQVALSAIRATGGNNAARFVAIPGLGETTPATVITAHARGKLLPDDEANGTNRLIVSVHYYQPSQYISELSNDPDWPLIHTWGTPYDKKHLAHEVGSLKTTFIDKGIAVYIGEWGTATDVRAAMSTEIQNTHLDYISSVAAAARANGMAPLYWDNGVGGGFKMLERSNGRPKTGLWADTLSAMMNAINTTVPLPPGESTAIFGNVGPYRFGIQADGVSANYQFAVWELSGTNIAVAQTAGTKLVLVLSTVPRGTTQFAWQAPNAAIWWKDKDILGSNGSVIGATGVIWDSGTRTLTIPLSASSVDDYSSFTSQTSLNLVIAYFGADNIDDLGIVSANLVSGK